MKIKKIIWFLISQTLYKMKFKKIGNKTIIIRPVQIDNSSNISVGQNTRICEGAWLMGGEGNKTTLHIGDSVCVGHFSHLIALRSVRIGNNVLIADKVFISDCTHKYEEYDKSIVDQGVEIISNVSIGEDSWIGENVSILGASIGKHSVIGANSVVIDDIPDYCVAVGSPAKIVKKYNFNTNTWDKL